MMKQVFKAILMNYAARSAKKKLALIYLKILDATRKSLLLSMLIFFIFQLMVLGFLGLAITAIWLLPDQDTQMKLYYLLSFFGFLFLIPAMAFMYLFSDKIWYRVSGAEKILEDI